MPYAPVAALNSILNVYAFLAVQIGRTARCDIGRTLTKPILDLLDQRKEDFFDVLQGRRQVRRGRYAAMVTAPCISACPSNVDIPSYLEDVRMDRWSRALETVKKDCPMPGTIGRVCVRPCESNCRRGRLDTPLAIRAVKRFLADQELFADMEIGSPLPPRQPSKGGYCGRGPGGTLMRILSGQAGLSLHPFRISGRTRRHGRLRHFHPTDFPVIFSPTKYPWWKIWGLKFAME